MSQLKDLVVTGKSRFIGTVYADDIVGNVRGIASEATLALKDIRSQQIDTTYIKGMSINDRLVTLTKGDNSTVELYLPDPTGLIDIGTASKAGLTKLYTSTGNNTDGSITQRDLTTLFNNKLDTTATAVKAVADNAGQQIDSTYIKDSSVSGRTITFTKGNGDTFSLQTQDTTYEQATTATLGLVKLYTSSGENTDGSMTQKATGEAIEYALAYGEAALATRARKDINGKDIDSYGASLSVNGRDVSLIDSVGSTISTIQTQDTTYTQATNAALGLVKIQATTGASTTDVMTQKAVSDALDGKLDINATAQAAIKDTEDQNITDYIFNADVNDRVITFTKGDGSTFSKSVGVQATDSTLGVVKIQATTGASTADAMTQKAITDELNTKIQNVTADTTGVTRKLTFTKGDGSTFERDLSYSQATSATLGLVQIQATTGTSTTDVMTQKAVTDELNEKLEDVTLNNTGTTRKLTFTKGDGSTSEYDLTYAQASTAAQGLVQLASSTGTSETNVMTQKAVTDAIMNIDVDVENSLKDVSLDDTGSNRVLTFTKINGSTADYDLSYAQATSSELGLVKIQSGTGTSTTDVMTQKATTDAINNNYNDIALTKDDTGVRKLTFTKGDGSTSEYDMSFAQATSSKLGLVKVQGTTGNSSTDVMSQQAVSDALVDVNSELDSRLDSVSMTKSGATRKLTFTKGDGSTSEYDLSYTQATSADLGLVRVQSGTGTSTTDVMSQKAVSDELTDIRSDISEGLTDVDLTSDVTGTRVLTFTKADGSTTEYDMSFAQATSATLGLVKVQSGTGTSTTDVMSQKVVSDELTNVNSELDDRLEDVSMTKSGATRKLTFTKGDGSTSEYDLSYGQATTADLGLVKLVGSTGSSTATVMTQKAVSDELTNVNSELDDRLEDVDLTSNATGTRKLTFTRGNGSTFEKDLSFAQATSATLGLVKVQSGTGTSTTDVMSQKAVSDAIDAVQSDADNAFVDANLTKDDTGVRKLTFTKGDGSTSEYDMSFDQASSSTLGLVKVQSSTGTSTTDTISQKAITDEFTNVSSELDDRLEDVALTKDDTGVRKLTFTKGDGSTTEYDMSFAQATTGKLGLVKLASSTGSSTATVMTQKAVSDQLTNVNSELDTRVEDIALTKDDTGVRKITVTKGNGATSEYDLSFAQATSATLGLVKVQSTTGTSTTDTMSQKAISDAIDAVQSDADNAFVDASLTKDNTGVRKLTFTKGDGSTSEYDMSFTQASTTDLGLVKLAGSTGSSTATVMTQKAASDAVNSKVETVALTKDDTGVRKLTVTKGNGSTSEYDMSFAQATSATLGLVKIQSSTGASTTDVMTQKAVSDVVNDKYNNVAMTKSGATRKLTFTKGDGSTAEFDLSYDQATTSTLGLVKLSGSTGASTATVMTQKATSDALTTLKSDLEEEIGRIFTAVIVESYEDLPVTGDSRYLYLVPTGKSGSNVYDEYIWIVDDEQTGEGHYELFGVSAIDLDAYYTSTETDAAITLATNDNVVNLTTNQTTVIFTKKDGSTGSFQTKDTTYTDYTVATGSTNGVSGLVPAPTQGQQDYILTGGNKWVAKAPNAVNADSATYATNSGTAVHASTADYASNAGTAIYATNADTATEATHAINADTATYAINSGTATYATNSGTAVSATKDSAGNNINTTYIKNAEVSGRVVTFTKGNGDTFSITTQDNNTTYGNFTTASASAAGAAGLVPAPAKGQQDYILTGSGWKSTASAAYATNAGTATEATHAVNADSATYATNAGTAVHASTADYATNAGTAVSATKDSAGQNINTTYIKGLSVDGRTITYTKGDGSTTSFQTQDNNTTYTNMGNASSAAAGTAGLVPAPAKGQQNYVLTGSGWKAKAPNATNADSATYATNAGTATEATHAVNADTATYATNAGTAVHASTADYATNAGSSVYATNAGTATEANHAASATNADSATYAVNAGTATSANTDSAGQNINTTYIKGLSVSGRTVTYTKGDGSTGSFQTQDNNTTYANMGNASSAAAGTAGLVPAPSKGYQDYVLTGSGWKAKAPKATNADSATYAINADTANYATNAGIATEANHAASATNADTATYAVNAGTAVHASTADYATNAGSSVYATNAGTATQATHATNADTATYATNSGTATYATNSGTAVSATKDSAGNNINTTYIKNASVSGRTVTFTKGNGDTFSFQTQDNNTTYANMSNASSAAAGTAGLVPAPAKGQQDYVLTGSGWKSEAPNATNAGTATEANHAVNADTATYATNSGTATHASTADYSTNSGSATYATNAGTATYSTNSGSADYATNTTNADSATYATNAGTSNYSTYDSAGQQINTTYIKDSSVSGKVITFTKGNGDTFSIITQDTNTTYANFTPATTSADGASGLVPKPTKSQVNYFLTGGGWATNIGTSAYATNSGTATHASTADYATIAVGDSAGQQINTTYIKNASVSGKTVTFTKGDNSTFSFQTQDTNTTYANMGNATSSTDGSAGLVPAPVAGQQDYILTGSGWKINAGTATYATNAGTSNYSTYDSAGQQIDSTYIKDASVSGRTVTFTKGNGDTFTIVTQDKNTTYANFTTASSAASGTAGLVPAPSAGEQNYFLTGSGWTTNVGTALYATNSGTATHASTADYSTKSGTANYSTYDSAGNNINTTYIKDASVVGKVVTFTKGDNSTFNITTQDTNTTYSAFTAPTGSVAGTAGLVPAPAKNTMNYILTASGWSNTASAAYATKAGTATHANDAVTTASVSGRTITFTKGNNSTFSITTQDNNTTYTLSNDGDSIKLNPSSGSATTVGLSDLINGLSIGTATPQDNDYYVTQYAGGGTSTTSYYRRPVSSLFNYMKGKFGTAAQKNVATSGNASTAEVVMGNDTRLTDSRNAKDVYSWAKAATKPSYSASEVGAIDATLKGAANGVAELDANGLVPSSQLPAYVDDVLEYATYADFPSEGTSGKIYVDLSTNLTYRWGGSVYVEISPSLALGETSSTAYRGDYGKTAYTHATDPNRLTTAKTSGFYKFAATSYGHVKSVTTVTKADITALGIPEADTHFVTHMYAGTGTANNASSTNGNTKLTIVDNTTVRNNITLTGSGGTTITSNASGTITVNSKNSMTGAYTPDGECTGGAVTLNTTEVPNITGVGTLPTCTFPTVSLSVNNNKELSITHTGGSFSQGTLPTTGTKITVATSVKTFTQPTFNGTASTVSVS